MDYGYLLRALPDQNDKARWIYIADLGNETCEIGVTNSLRGTVQRYVTVEQPAAVSVWISKQFDANPQPVDPRLEAQFGLQLDDWVWASAQLGDFCNRAAVSKLSEVRFFGLPAQVVVTFAKCRNLGPGTTHIFE